MRRLLLLLLAGCANDTTNLIQPQGDDHGPRETDAGIHVPELPRQPDAGGIPERPDAEPEASQLCLVVDPEPAEFLLRVRASAERFRDRLGIPVALCDTGVPILVQEHVWQSPTVGVGGKATFEGHVCRFSECNTRAKIQIALHETELPDTIDAVLDHEIGHILSGWGKFSKETDKSGHLPVGNLMGGNLLPPHQQWTQDDTDLWCSASPCVGHDHL